MRFRKREPLYSFLIDTGLNLLDSLRDRLPDNVGDIKSSVRDTYSSASNRVGRAADALRGEEDSQLVGKAIALAIGVGIGVGIGLLIAPASGEETRADIADKVSDFGDKVVKRNARGQLPGVTASNDDCGPIMLKINVETIGDVAVVECEGRLVKNNAALRLPEAVTAQEAAQIVVLRLSAVYVIEDKSLVMLVSLRRWARVHNIRFMLYDPSKCVRKGLERVRAISDFCVPTLEDMMALLTCAGGQYATA
jgi:anti-anti-sigma regulatory factor